MINEAYVSFEIAKLLKEKGFDGGCTCLMEDFKPYNMVRTTWPQTYKEDGSYFNHKGLLLCPTHQMAMAWLREEKGLHISCCIQEDTAEDADGNTVDIWTYWEWGVIRCCDGSIIETSSIDEQYQTYEEAVEAAIKYSLKNLI